MADKSSNRLAREPARGERGALIGYHAQYRGAATLLLKVLNESRFEFVRIADPTAGRVDDWQVFTTGCLDAYQFKWPKYSRPLTLLALLEKRSGQEPLLKSLADGWKERKKEFPNRRVTIHFITNGYPSTAQQKWEPRGNALGETHLAAFLEDSWNPVQNGVSRIPSPGEPWAETWRRIALSTGLKNTELTEFVMHCLLTFAFNTEVPDTFSPIEKDAWEDAVRSFTERLLFVPSNKSPIITLDRVRLVELFGLKSEAVPSHVHDFRLDPNAQKPLRKTASELETSLEKISSGYICLSGSPGSGKSSTLTLVLRGSNERVVMYYAYTPDSPNQNQGESATFFAYLVTELKRLGFSHKGSAPHRGDLALLKERFKEQLAGLARDYAKTGRKTIILIDGLDHIEREQSPDRSLLKDLLVPSEIPAGIIFLLGTQSQQLLRPNILQSIREAHRSLVTMPLEALEVGRVLDTSKAAPLLDQHRRQEVVRLAAGHPLALGYLIRMIEGCASPEAVDALLETQNVFTGNILHSYRAYWDELGKSGFKVKQLLGWLARLRRPAESDWVRTWADPESIDQLRSRFSHYFERSTTSWQFFHNSFRIFVLEATCEDSNGDQDNSIHRDYHVELAKFCAKSPLESLWQAERFHHLIEAGDTSAALEIARPEWFRSQFISMRAESEIRSDLRRALALAASERSGFHLCRLVIANSEIESRFQALELESSRLLKVLLRTKQVPLAIRRIRTERQLHVSHDTALELCAALLEIGEEGEAGRVFDLVNPYIAETQGPGDSLALTQRRMLVKWGITAISFIPTTEILRVFENCIFKPGSDWDRSEDKKPEPDQILERTQAIAEFAVWTTEAGNDEVANAFATVVDWNLLPKSFRLAFSIAKLERSLALARSGSDSLIPHDGLTAEFLELVTSANVGRRLHALEILIRLGEIEVARNIFSKIDSAAIARGIGGYSASDGPERLAREWLRIGHALDQPDLSESLFENPSIGGHVSSSIVRSHLSVAALHAKSLVPNHLDHTELKNYFGQVLNPLDRGFLGADEWSELHRSMPGIFDDLVDACHAHGQWAITALAEFLDHRWNQPAGLRNWPVEFQRRLLTDLCSADANPTWANPWMNYCESQIDLAASAGSRVSHLFDQAEAWLAVGDKDQALNSLQNAFQFSLGIGYHKDFQLSSWLGFARHAWKKDWRPSKELISKVARAAVSLRHDVHGGAMGEAAELLVSYCFQAEPLLGLKLWDYFSEQGTVSFPSILAELLKSTSGSNDEDPQIAAHVLCEILIPISDFSDPGLVVDILRRLHLTYGTTGTGHAVDQISSRIGTLARSEHRAGWWRGIRRACKELKMSLPTADASWEDMERRGNDTTEEAIAAVAEAEDAIEALKDVIAHTKRRAAQHDYSTYVDFAKIAPAIAPTLSASQIEQCRELVSDDSYTSARIAAALACRALEPNIRRILWNWSLGLYSEADEKSDESYVIEREIRPIFVALLAADPTKGRELLFQSLQNHRWLSPESLDQLAPHLITSPEQKSDFEREIFQHLELLLQGLAGEAPELSLDGLAATSPINSSTALMRLVFGWLNHPCGEIRHGARRIARLLSQSGNTTWKDELRLQLKANLDAPVLLGLIDSMATSELIPTIGFLIPELRKLVFSGDFETRAFAHKLLSRLDAQVPSILAVKELHPTYLLGSPSPPELGPVAKYMGEFANLCSRITGIPLFNLYRRIDEFAETLPTRHWSEAEQRAVARRLADTGLYFEFQLPAKKLGARIAFRMLAEFHDAGLIANEDFPSVLGSFTTQDHFLSDLAPSTKPRSLAGSPIGFNSQAWSEEWLDQCDNPPLDSAPFTDDGWIIVGYRHSTRVHTDNRPREVHLGLLNPPEDADSLGVLDHESTFFDRAQPFAFSDYYEWAELSREGGDPAFFVLGGQSKDLPSPPWLALHPDRAKQLGWIADPSSLFAWKDESGHRVAESRWWSDGPYQSSSTDGNRTTASGWTVVFSPRGFAEAQSKFGSMRFHSRADRFHAG